MILGLIIGLVFGLAIGGAAVWYWQRGSDAESSLRELRAQHEALRCEVADHFVRTADLVNSLTDSYKEVFDHLRDGAERLVDRETLNERLSYSGRNEVRLQMIGSGARAQTDSATGFGDTSACGKDRETDRVRYPGEGVEGDDSRSPERAKTGRDSNGRRQDDTGEPPDPFNY